MIKLEKFVPALALLAMISIVGCATASNKTEAVGEDTGSAAASVGNGIVAVIEWPFHAIADIL